jgi:hypothetical protein
MSASALKIMSPAAMRLFELPADSQEILFTAKDKVAVDSSPALLAKSVPISHQDIFEIKPDILSADEGCSSKDFQNCPMLTAILQDSPRTIARNAPKCSLCHKSFESKRLLKAHEKVCRREGSNRVIVCQANGWTCSICYATGNHLREFKDHIFFLHGDREAQELYQRSWVDLLGRFCLERHRLALTTSIRLGQFLSQVQSYAAMRTSLNLGGLDL